jgi:hypothetical protein
MDFDNYNPTAAPLMDVDLDQAPPSGFRNWNFPSPGGIANRLPTMPPALMPEFPALEGQG